MKIKMDDKSVAVICGGMILLGFLLVLNVDPTVGWIGVFLTTLGMLVIGIKLGIGIREAEQREIENAPTSEKKG